MPVPAPGQHLCEAGPVLFDAFRHGVDVSVQALTKYVGGHSDLLLGSVSVSSPELYEKVGSIWGQLGMAVSPDDASLALRGLQTLGIRLERLESSALKIAKWLKSRPEIETVLHPALPDCPGHDLWKRDFTGSASVFSFVFDPEVAVAEVPAFVDRLKLFRKGFSWGGTASLAMISTHALPTPSGGRTGISKDSRQCRSPRRTLAWRRSRTICALADLSRALNGLGTG